MTFSSMVASRRRHMVEYSNIELLKDQQMKGDRRLSQSREPLRRILHKTRSEEVALRAFCRGALTSGPSVSSPPRYSRPMLRS